MPHSAILVNLTTSLSSGIAERESYSLAPFKYTYISGAEFLLFFLFVVVSQMFPRLYALFLAGIYTASLSVPTLLHTRHFVTIETQTWLALIVIQFALVLMAQVSVMKRIHSQYQVGNVYHMLINAVFLPVTCSLTSLSFVTLLSISFLYSEEGNNYIELANPLISKEAYALLSALHFQLFASISGGILFSLELYAELFRSTSQEDHPPKKKSRSNDKTKKNNTRKTKTTKKQNYSTKKNITNILKYSWLTSKIKLKIS